MVSGGSTLSPPDFRKGFDVPGCNKVQEFLARLLQFFNASPKAMALVFLVPVEANEMITSSGILSCELRPPSLQLAE